MYVFKWSQRVAGAVCCALAATAWVPGVAGAAVAGPKWAVVSATGTLVRGSGVTSVTRRSTGTYAVRFDTSMTTCAYQATAGDPTGDGLVFPIVPSVASLAGAPNGVVVQTYDQSTGTLANEPFNLTTYCGSKSSYAVVGGDGSLARGSHVVSSTRVDADGKYNVVFDHDVSGCAFVATIGSVGTAQIAVPGEVDLAPGPGPDAVAVSTLSRLGSDTDSSFHLAVNCGAKKLTAVIDQDGTRVRGGNVVSSARVLPFPHGGYVVTFNRDVSSCSYAATIALSVNDSIDDAASVTTANRGGNGVFVLTENVVAGPFDEPFHLVVTC